MKLVSKITFIVTAEIENRPGPFRYQSTSSNSVLLCFSWMLVKIHDGFSDARLLQVRLVNGWELKLRKRVNKMLINNLMNLHQIKASKYFHEFADMEDFDLVTVLASQSTR